MSSTRGLRPGFLARLRRDESGFTLVEAIVAITVMLASILVVAYTVTAGLSFGDLARQKQTATGIADQVMEQVRGLAWDKVTAGHLSSDLGVTRGDLPVTNPDTGYLVTGCSGDASGVYRLFSCSAGSQPGSGEKVVASALACTGSPDCVSPLVRHAGKIVQNNITYVWRTYDTNNCPTATTAGCTAATPYRVTVVVTWTGGSVAPNKIVQVQSLFWSPSGCRSSATHPFAAPCQPFFFGTATAHRGSIDIAGTVDQSTFQSADLFTPEVQSSVQQEQLSQAQGRFEQSGVQLVDGSSPNPAAGGTIAISTAADTDPGTSASTWSRVRCGDPGATCSGGSVTTGTSNTVTLTAPDNETAESDSTTSAGSGNVCPPPADAAQSDLKPCGGSRIQQGGPLSAVLLLNGTSPQLGTATLGEILAAANSPDKTFVDRVQNGQSPAGLLCSPVTGSNGCLEEQATRTIGTVNVGGLPSGLAAPTGWNGSYLSIVGYQDQLQAAVGTNSTSSTAGASVPAPSASISSSGTLSCWNGLDGYNSVSTNSPTAVTCAPLTLTQPVNGGHTVTVTISASTTAGVITRSPSSSNPTITKATAQVTPPGAVISYSIAVDTQTVVNLTLTVNLNTLEASGSYAAAPGTGS